MPHRLPPLPCSVFAVLLVSVSLVTVGTEKARAQSPPTTIVYSSSQPPRTWNTRPGGLTFEGRALRREGDFVAFETTRKLQIWLPVRYLSNQGQTYLNALGAASSPLTLDVTRPQVDTGPGGFGAPTGMINPNPSQPGTGSAGTPNTGTTDTASTNPNAPTPETSAPEDTAAMPAKDPADPEDPFTDPTTPEATAEPAKRQTYEPRQIVEVRVAGQWHRGQVFAQNPAQQKYFVSYRVDNAPRSGWFEAVDMRAVVEEEDSDETESDAISSED